MSKRRLLPREQSFPFLHLHSIWWASVGLPPPLPLLAADAIVSVAMAANRCPLLLPPQLLPMCIPLFSLMMFKILLRPSIILNIFPWCDPGQLTTYHPSHSTYWPMPSHARGSRSCGTAATQFESWKNQWRSSLSSSIPTTSTSLQGTQRFCNLHLISWWVCLSRCGFRRTL